MNPNLFTTLIPQLSNVPNFIEGIINKPSIFNIAPKKNLWYNWATSVGKKYTCITYSAGTTYFFQNQEPLQFPVINIFYNSSINNKNEQKPLYSITIPIQGIRSAIVIDDQNDPYVLLGTFIYPQIGVKVESSIFKWNFTTGKLNKIFTIRDTNSIRTFKRYKTNCCDKIFFSSQEDLILQRNSKLYLVDTKDTFNNNIQNLVKTIKLNQNNKPIFGTVWDFNLDNDTIYLSIPISSPNPNKLSGFAIKGRLYYQKISSIISKNSVNLLNLIGNNIYPDGFGLDALSTFQIQTTSCSTKIYVYSLSDFLYQTLSILQNPNRNDIITENIMIPGLIESVRKIAQNLDLNGTRIFTINKNDLYKKSIPKITTILGEAPKNTVNKSSTDNGNNNFLNVYTWQSTSFKKNIYFGTLDVRFPVWQFLAQIIGKTLKKSQITQTLLSLPNPIIIFLTEFFLNINFNPKEFIKTYFNKQLHFDLIKYNENSFSPITLNGFQSINPFLTDDGVRNLDVVDNCNGTFLLVGSTCYQPNNVAKVYSLKINQTL